MRKAARAIIVQDGKLLVMHRNKFGTEYYTLIGGGVEPGETEERAVVREVFEETSLQVTGARLVFVEEAGEPFGTQYIFLCQHVAGEPVLHPDAVELSLNKMGKNLYDPLWLPIDQLPSVPFKSEALKVALVHALQSGFPDHPANIDPGIYHESLIK